MKILCNLNHKEESTVESEKVESRRSSVATEKDDSSRRSSVSTVEKTESRRTSVAEKLAKKVRFFVKLSLLHV